MSKALIITEKPSVARDIASALGGFREHDGWFERDDYVLTFAVGHLFELLEPEEVDEKYKRWTLDTLPILPDEFRYKPKRGQAERIRTIRNLLVRDDVDSLVNACDAGREGELIFREIVDHLDSRKPIRRLWLRSMTDQAIRQGFGALRPGSELEGLASAARCRARSDWLIGMNATRAFTKRLKSRKEKTAWSAGRVQTPTLALLVGRELEILSHQPRPYWRVSASFEHAGERYEAGWFDPGFRGGDDPDLRDDRIFDEARARAIAAAVGGRPGVASETRKPSRESAPPLFDLTSLQREANRRFGWSARRTLSAAQRCYERHKILTYPRTDSRCLPADYRETVDATLEALAGAGGEALQDYAAGAARLREAGLQNEKRVFDDSGVSDHFAIVPTGVLPTADLSGDDRRLFDLAVRRFLGAFYPPALWERVERTTEVAGERFRSRDRHLKQAGWRAVLPAAPDEGSGTALRPLAPGRDEAEGVAVGDARVEIVGEQTRPPPRITEARLLSLMENAGRNIEDDDLAAVLHEKGLGTPATRADIIENLIAKGYAVRVDKALRPTVKGIRLIDILRRIHVDRLTSPELTGEIESHLREVEHGRRQADDFMGEITDYATEIVERARGFEYHELYAGEEPLGPCPSCGRPVLEMVWFYRCQEEPPRDPDCPLRFWKDTSGRYLDRQSVRALIRDGQTAEIDGFTARNGRTYRGRLELDREEWKIKVKSLGYDAASVSDEPEYEVNPEPLGRCPFEEECQVVESPTHFLCERKLKEEEHGQDDSRPASCGFSLPRTVCKREITREEVLPYLEAGKTGLLEDFTSRFGRPFSATLVLRKTGRHGFEFPPRAARGAGERKGPGAAAPGRRKAGKKAPTEKAPTKTAKPRGRKPAGGAAKAPRKAGAARKQSGGGEP